MITHIFSVYDLKAFAFITPFILPTPEMAVRTFAEAANDPTHMFCKHPTDFTLYHIGEFSCDIGEVTKYDVNINLGMAANFKKGDL